MEKQVDAGLRTLDHRRLSQIKVLSRLIEHELDTGKGKEVTLDRELVVSMLDTLEVYVDDFEQSRGHKERRGSGEKQPVTRLN